MILLRWEIGGRKPERTGKETEIYVENVAPLGAPSGVGDGGGGGETGEGGRGLEE